MSWSRCWWLMMGGNEMTSHLTLIWICYFWPASCIFLWSSVNQVENKMVSNGWHEKLFIHSCLRWSIELLVPSKYVVRHKIASYFEIMYTYCINCSHCILGIETISMFFQQQQKTELLYVPFIQWKCCRVWCMRYEVELCVAICNTMWTLR